MTDLASSDSEILTLPRQMSQLEFHLCETSPQASSHAVGVRTKYVPLPLSIRCTVHSGSINQSVSGPKNRCCGSQTPCMLRTVRSLHERDEDLHCCAYEAYIRLKYDPYQRDSRIRTVMALPRMKLTEGPGVCVSLPPHRGSAGPPLRGQWKICVVVRTLS
ncbi:hypothetical protein DAEQUDRAFT_731929 [Daedalea quercina L-15889]|uniref:Uncharacterized protein n=1 Tax=Daedalea quercina L-15889 TaxID=1314783 RepID=A0A165LX76_9APHY|nr:hypothetical protein DAEQUDRAFT_731929 [Daedalea quercina L-15889]